MPDNPTQRLMLLFAGNPDAHGTHGEPTYAPDKSKWEVRSTAQTIHEAPTLEMWQQHVDGVRPMCAIPIRKDGTCSWGCIDIDKYDMDLASVIATVERLGYPVLAVRSKSGGLHLFLFTTVPVAADLMQMVLKNIAAKIGFGGGNSEIFPKQTQLSDSVRAAGNFMNAPYFGGTYGDKIRAQVGLRKNGTSELTLEEFCDLAEKRAVTPEQFGDMTKAIDKRAPDTKNAKGEKTRGPFHDGPPCIEILSARKVVLHEGQNNFLFQIGVYLKNAHPGDWKERLKAANQDYLNPPGTLDGLNSVVKSLSGKDYRYKCKDEPMMSHCDSRLCRRRKHGVGEHGDFPEISCITKLDSDPEVWLIDLAEGQVECARDQLYDYRRFSALCLGKLNKFFRPMKAEDWSMIVDAALKDVILLPVPKEVGNAGLIEELINDWLTNYGRGDRREDILSGRAWEDEDEGRYYFQIKDLQSFLERRGQKNMTRGQIVRFIQKMNGDAKFLNIKESADGRRHGKGCWWIPSEELSPMPPLDTPPPPAAEESNASQVDGI